MATFLEMTTTIADMLNRSDLSTQIKDEINNAIGYYYEAFRFWFQEKIGTFATIASQQAYGTADGTPTDINEIDYVKIAYASNWNKELMRVTYQEIENYNIGNYTGKPEKFAIYQEKFYLWPIPDAAYTVTVAYTQTYSELSADADTNDFTNYATELIQYRAISAIYENYLFDNNEADRKRVREIEQLNRLVRKTEKYISSGQITATSW